MSYVVYVNHPTNKAIVHNTLCGKWSLLNICSSYRWIFLAGISYNLLGSWINCPLHRGFWRKEKSK